MILRVWRAVGEASVLRHAFWYALWFAIFGVVKCYPWYVGAPLLAGQVAFVLAYVGAALLNPSIPVYTPLCGIPSWALAVAALTLSATFLGVNLPLSDTVEGNLSAWSLFKSSALFVVALVALQLTMIYALRTTLLCREFFFLNIIGVLLLLFFTGGAMYFWGTTLKELALRRAPPESHSTNYQIAIAVTAVTLLALLWVRHRKPVCTRSPPKLMQLVLPEGAKSMCGDLYLGRSRVEDWTRALDAWLARRLPAAT